MPRPNQFAPPAAVYALLALLALGCNQSPDSQAVGKVHARAETSPEAERTRQPTVAPLYRDSSESTEDRIADLLGRMSTAEKIAQLTHLPADRLRPAADSALATLADSARRAIPHGVGYLSSPTDWGDEKRLAYLNALQRHLTENTRLGIPALVLEEPSSPTLAQLGATFDTTLVREYFARAGRRAAGRGAHLVLGPTLSGTDPYLLAQLGLAAVRGLEEKVYAVPRYFGGQDTLSAGPRALGALHLYPYRYLLARAPIQAIVAGPGQIDGVPIHADRRLLYDLLRGDWGYRGAVLSADGGVTALSEHYAVTEGPRRAAIQALRSGIDVELASGAGAFPELVSAVNDGSLAESILDQAVARVLRLKFARGLFENPYPPIGTTTDPGLADTALLRRLASSSAVLLKNDERTLPLIGPPRRVALSGFADFPALRRGLTEWADTAGWSLTDLAGGGPAAARRAVRRTDLLIVITGAAPAEPQRALIRELAERGRPVLALLPEWPVGDAKFLREHCAAILHYPPGNPEAGHSLAEILSGQVSPGGKLPLEQPGSPYAFGHGLGYGDCVLSAPRLADSTLRLGATTSLSVEVHNRSETQATSEVIQLYVRDEYGSVVRADRQLRGFARVQLGPGERRTVTFPVGPEQLELLDRNLDWTVEPGAFVLWVGTSGRVEDWQRVRLRVTGNAAR